MQQREGKGAVADEHSNFLEDLTPSRLEESTLKYDLPRNLTFSHVSMESVIPEPTPALWSDSEPHQTTPCSSQSSSRHPPSTRRWVGLGQNSGPVSLSVESPTISQTCPLKTFSSG